jgi:CelD/BcsL family acetyltransferase involved in cellulose biosynthesis
MGTTAVAEPSVQVHRGQAGLESISAEWHELERRPGTRCSVFQSQSWVRAWSRHLAADDPLVIISVRRGEALCGLVPLALARDGKLLTFAGCPLNDRNGAVTDEANLVAVWSETLKFLAGSDCWNELSVADMDTPDFAALPDRVPGLHIGGLGATSSPVVELPESVPEFRQRISRHRRGVMRRQQTALGGGAAVRVDVGMATPSRLREMHGMRLKRWASTGELDRLSNQERSTDFAEFLCEWSTGSTESDAPLLARLLVDGRCIASHLCIAQGDAFMVYMTSYDRAYARFSPGIHCHTMTMEYAIANGFAVYDFGRGTEAYKYSLGARDRALPRVSIRHGLRS